MKASAPQVYLSNITAIHSHFRPQKILLVTGQHSYSMCGAEDAINQVFDKESYIHFSDFSINPKIEDAIRGADLALKHDIDFIIAIGGGSVIDMAKLIKAFMPDPNNAKKIVTGKSPIKHLKIPLTAIPTTAGSGSESTHFAVAYIAKEKFSLASPYLLPNAIILDETFLQSSSAYQRAVNALDALAQAIEGYWAVSSTSETRKLSLTAIQLLVKHLPRIIENNEMYDLQKVQYAANLAGQVINITKTTAPHAFSYAFTSYHNVPHGHAVWLTLPAIFELHMNATSSDIIDPRGLRHLKPLMESLSEVLNIDPEQPKDALQAFMKAIGVEPSMEVMGVNTNTQKSFSANQVNIERLSNNPISITDKKIASIFNIQ